MRALHLFAGAGGSVLAGHLLGWESVGCVEIDPFCCAVLEKNGERVIGNDVTTFDGRQYVGSVDVVVGGSPCQDLSVAGKRAGLGGERSSLWHHQLRIAVECEAPFIFWENVRGALSSNNGRDFGVILRGLADHGYDARWGVFRAVDVGAPHRRERVFLVAHRHRGGEQQQKGRVGEVRGWIVDGGEGMDNTNSAQRKGDWSADGIRAEHREHNGTHCVEHAECIGRNESHAIPEPGNIDQANCSSDSRTATGAQRGLGRAIDGMAEWLDASNAGDFRWPAGKGAFQYPHEASRVIAKEGQIRRMNRLKALGNGWVPQQAALAWRTLTNDL